MRSLLGLQNDLHVSTDTGTFVDDCEFYDLQVLRKLEMELTASESAPTLDGS